MTHFVMMIGLPGSGKSTFTNNHYSAKSGYTRLSTDDYIENKAVEIGKTYNEIFGDAIKEATVFYNQSFDQLIKEKKAIVVDRTNLTVTSRKKTLSRIPKDYKKTAVFFVNDERMIEHVRKINDQRQSFGRSLPPIILENMLDNVDEPQAYEGFDEIITIQRFV